MDHVSSASDVTVCEGTGHCAVGSIVGLNNAKVANILGADMVLIANGGLGRYDFDGDLGDSGYFTGIPISFYYL